ncbi:MAG: hypothetical protein ACN4GF_06205 [Lentimonas sp.]
MQCYHTVMMLFLRISLFLLVTVSEVDAAINIVLDYGVTSTADIETYGATFEAAESFWEANLTGYSDGPLAPTSVTLNVALGNIDGVGGTLGSAGPTLANTQGNFLETTQGNMTFDTSDIGGLVSAGTFEAVIRHEMAHVLGFGTLWSSSGAGQPGFQEVYVDGTGEYTGAFGLAAFQTEFNQPAATYVPVELDGGVGTANGHWNVGFDLGVDKEVVDSRDDPGDSIIYVSVNNGQQLANELMSGFLTGDAWLSNTTLQSFRDLGYEIELSPVPEPGLFSALLGFSALAVVLSRRRPVST